MGKALRCEKANRKWGNGMVKPGRFSPAIKHLQRDLIYRSIVCLGMAFLLVFLIADWSTAQDPDRVVFSSPQEAAQALADACATNNLARLLAILGPFGQDLVSSGDEVADQAARARLASAYQDMHNLVPEGPEKQVLHLGSEDWAMPIPIVKRSAPHRRRPV